jgi:transcriptional regulator with XRE-family HTH domain
MDELAEKVRAERLRRAWTQQELADAAGVSMGTVSNFERRVSDPQPPKLRKMIEALDLERAAGDDQASETRTDWPADVKTFLDLMGLFLVGMDETQRYDVMYDLTRQIVARPRP